MTNANQSEYLLPECNFAELETSIGVSNECSPTFTNKSTNFKGIVINGPKEMTWPKDVQPQEASPWGTTKGPARLMIAGRFRLPEDTMGFDGWFQTEILFVAVNQQTKHVYSGKVPQVGTRPKRMSKRTGNDPNRIAGGVVNADLVNIAGVPIANAIYTVYATLGDYKSNVITIKTIVK